jgi:uncharacterized protein YbaA (DUF1428 family)
VNSNSGFTQTEKEVAEYMETTFEESDVPNTQGGEFDKVVFAKEEPNDKVIFTKEEFNEKFDIEKKLKMAEEELTQIELTADKTKRLRWRELNKIIKHYKTIL